MAIIKLSEIKKMSDKEREEKIRELRIELIKSRVNLAKGGKTKIREIKKTVARLLTFNKNFTNKKFNNKQIVGNK